MRWWDNIRRGIVGADGLIISRGFNVSPAEVEAVLHAVPLPGLPLHDGLSAELKAHVEAEYGDPVPIREVRLVRELPKTVTGKVQRNLLR
ncbi:hypothetical protein R6V09_18610 [Streptomyces sp. W16]|uniref:AMP-binding enzyme n=1 Tax=Streptomyces sp. W16 TaxID=3076631 RepID=UPI00295A6E75|nr:hypothetical protein [Streptomyces sp. W16]MDV9172113.1 hypothetical protein [Streptomyces sp. W16]